MYTVSKLPLSSTAMPFGSLWIRHNDPLAIKYPWKLDRTPEGRLRKHPYSEMCDYVLISLKGLTFDEVPLRYLDWLSGDPVLGIDRIRLPNGKYVSKERRMHTYGAFRARLTLYLRHPAIQRELEELFPDYDDDSRQPLFTASPEGVTCLVNNPRADRWHGQSMPEDPTREGRFYRKRLADEEPIPEGWICINPQDVANGYKRVIEKTDDSASITYATSKTKLWQRAAEYFLLFESISDPQDWQERVVIGELRAIISGIPSLKKRLAEAYKTAHQRILSTWQPASLDYFELYDAAARIIERLPADKEFAQRAKKLVTKTRRSTRQMIRRDAKRFILQRHV